MCSTGKVAGEGRPPANEMISGRWVIFRISRMNELCSWLARSEKRHSIGFGFSIFMLVSQWKGAAFSLGHYRARRVSGALAHCRSYFFGLESGDFNNHVDFYTGAARDRGHAEGGPRVLAGVAE